MQVDGLRDMDERARAILLPILVYKSIFIGDWYKALIREERDPQRRETLVRISQETDEEVHGVANAVKEWKGAMLDPETADQFVTSLDKLLLRDLMDVKHGSAEAIVHAAMRAPTAAIRDRLMDLAAIDRAHADALRAALDGPPTTPTREKEKSRTVVGAHEGRGPHATLGDSIRAHLEELRGSGGHPSRLMLSPDALRHLRDEGLVSREGKTFDLPSDVDLAWKGECYAFLTDERMRLAELVSGDEPSRLTTQKTSKSERNVPPHVSSWSQSAR